MGTRKGDAAGIGAGFVAPGNWQVNDAIRDSRMSLQPKSEPVEDRTNVVAQYDVACYHQTQRVAKQSGGH
jgi:hypothetical protein